MIRRLLASAALLLLTLALQAQSPRLLDAGDCGLRPGEGHDNGPALTALADRLRRLTAAGDSIVLRIAPGVYPVREQSLPRRTLYITNHDHHPDRAAALDLRGVRRLRVEAEGATLSCHGRLLPVVISDCTAVTLVGLTIDYPRPSMSQLEILSAEGDAVEGRLLRETRYAVEDNRLYVEGEGYRNPILATLPFDAEGHMKWGRADSPFDPQSLTDLGDGRLRLRGWSEAPFVTPGDRYALRSWDRPTPAITIADSRGIALERVTIHFADGMGVAAQDSKDLTLDGVAVRRREGSGRYFTLQADATHFSNCRGRIISRRGLYEGMADDAINVHGVYLRVDSLLAPHRLLATFAHPQTLGLAWGRPGDTLRLIDRATLLPLAVTTLVAIEAPDAEHKILTLADALPDSLPAEMAAENRSAAPSVLFEDNVVRDNRARGALFSTHRPVVCRHNLFDHTHGSAILLSGDANGWYESGPCEEVLISGNRFVDALTAEYQFTRAVISIFPVLRTVVQGQYYHGRIVIEGNTFETFPTPLLYALSVRELVWRDNHIRRSYDYPPLFDRCANTLTNVGKAEVEGSEVGAFGY